MPEYPPKLGVHVIMFAGTLAMALFAVEQALNGTLYGWRLALGFGLVILFLGPFIPLLFFPSDVNHFTPKQRRILRNVREVYVAAPILILDYRYWINGAFPLSTTGKNILVGVNLLMLLYILVEQLKYQRAVAKRAQSKGAWDWLGRV